MSETSAANPQTLGVGEHPYTLSSDLAKMCLPTEFRDAGHRRLAWVNSICFLFLVVGVVGLRSPRVVVRPLTKLDETVPVIFTPPPEQLKPEQPKPEEPQEQQDTPTEAPQVITVVAAANPSQVAFAVPVQGAVAVAEARYATAPPPANYVAPPSKPTAFNPDTQDGGYHPKPDYPGMAQRNRYQGTVLIELKVDETGAVTSAEIQKTSGYTILDQAALNTVKSQWRFPPGKQRWFITPIVFQLL